MDHKQIKQIILLTEWVARIHHTSCGYLHKYYRLIVWMPTNANTTEINKNNHWKRAIQFRKTYDTGVSSILRCMSSVGWWLVEWKYHPNLICLHMSLSWKCFNSGAFFICIETFSIWKMYENLPKDICLYFAILSNSSHHFCDCKYKFLLQISCWVNKKSIKISIAIDCHCWRLDWRVTFIYFETFFSLFYANSILISLWSIFFNDVFICTKNSLAFYVPNFNCFFFAISIIINVKFHLCFGPLLLISNELKRS